MNIKCMLFIFTCAIFMLFMQSCGSDGYCDYEPKTNSFYISETDKNKIPVTGTDTLTYEGTNGELAVLYGQGKLNKTSCESLNNMLNPDCRDDQNCFETISFPYTGDNPQLNSIFIRYIATKYAPAQTDFGLSIGYHSVNEIRLGYLNNSTNYSDTVVIDSIVYLGRKVNIDENQDYSFVYNHKYGILKITASNIEWFKRL